jgi:hypothetical protein
MNIFLIFKKEKENKNKQKLQFLIFFQINSIQLIGYILMIKKRGFRED